MVKPSYLIGLMLVFGLSLFVTLVSVTRASSGKSVRQAVLLIRKSNETQDRFTFPIKVAESMNISFSTLNADLQELTETVLYDGEDGRFSLIFVTASSITQDLDTSELAVLDQYEGSLGVAEALLGPVAPEFASRYGVASLGLAQRFLRLRWANNDLTNFMNTSMYPTTLDTNTTVYAYGGNESQINPVVWSYASDNKIRVASSIGSLPPSTGDTFAFWAPFWLACKLSPANRILKLYWAIDIDDVMYRYSDNGVYGAPAVSNLHLDGSDIQHAIDNLLAPLGFTPTLAIMYSDNSKLNMTTEYPELHSVLVANQGTFDFTPHNHLLSYVSYQQALDMIRSDRNAISDWGLLPTLYYMIPGNYAYSSETAPALTDSPLWYVAQIFSVSSNTHPYISNPGDFDSWSSSLFRVPRWGWVPYNARNSSQVLVQSGKPNWDMYWQDKLDLMFGFTAWSPCGYIGGYHIEGSHMHNWVYGRQNSDAPIVSLIRNLTEMNIFPIVPVRSWAIAENLYFIRNFRFNTTYNLEQNTLHYTIAKSNANARDRITLNFEGKVRPLDFNPDILRYDNNSTVVTFTKKDSITLKMDEQETSAPFINNWETSLLTSVGHTGHTLVFTVSAPSGTMTTTEVYVGDKRRPNDVSGATSWSYNSTSRSLTINALHSSPITITITWRLEGDVNRDGTIDASDLFALSQAFGSTGGPPPSDNWNPDADLNEDNRVNLLDLHVLGKHYGE